MQTNSLRGTDEKRSNEKFRRFFFWFDHTFLFMYCIFFWFFGIFLLVVKLIENFMYLIRKKLRNDGVKSKKNLRNRKISNKNVNCKSFFPTSAFFGLVCV